MKIKNVEITEFYIEYNVEYRFARVIDDMFAHVKNVSVFKLSNSVRKIQTYHLIKSVSSYPLNTCKKQNNRMIL